MSTPVGFAAAEVSVGVVTLVGNALVLAAIQRTRSLRTVTNCFVASLALADLMVGVVLVPYTMLNYFALPHDFYGCVFLNCVIILFTQVSIFSLLAVACERFLAIKDPFLYQRVLTIRRAIMGLVVTWIAAILVGLVPMMGWNRAEYLNITDIGPCQFVKVIEMEYMVYFNFLGFVMVPLCLMFAIYAYIYVIVRQQMSKISALEVTSQNRRKKRQFLKEIKAAKSLAFVIGLFTVCWMPIHIMNTITLLLKKTSIEALYAAIVLSHANSMFNPFLYAYGNSQFKRAFGKMFCCLRPDFFTDSDSFAGRSNLQDSRVPNGTLVTNGQARHGQNTDSSNGHTLPTVSGSVPMNTHSTLQIVGRKKTLPPINSENSSESNNTPMNGTVNPTFSMEAEESDSKRDSATGSKSSGNVSSSKNSDHSDAVAAEQRAGTGASNAAFTLEPETGVAIELEEQERPDTAVTSDKTERITGPRRKVAFQSDSGDRDSVHSLNVCEEHEMVQPIAIEGNTLIFRL